jgi:hypothetical protein
VRLKNLLRQKDFAYAALGLALFVIALGFCNRHRASWDWTKDHRFTLPAHAVRLLRSLDLQVKIVGFITSPAAKALLQKSVATLEQARPGHFSLEFHNAFQEPNLAKQLGIGTEDQALIQIQDPIGGTRATSLHVFSVDQLSEAIQHLLVFAGSHVMVTQGHGERPLNNQGPFGLGLMQREIAREGGKLDAVSWDQVSHGDLQGTVIALIGTAQDLNPSEQAGLISYLSRGGKLLALLDPAHPETVSKVLERLAIRVGPEVVRDAASPYSRVSLNAIAGQGYDARHPVSSDAQASALFELCAPIYPDEANPASARWVPLIKSSPEAYTIPLPFRELTAAEKSKRAHATFVLLAATGGPSPEETRAIVAGTSQLFTNEYMQSQPGNQELMLKSLDWLVSGGIVPSWKPAAAATEEPHPLAGLALLGLAMLHIIVIPSLVLLAGALWRQGREQQ